MEEISKGALECQTSKPHEDVNQLSIATLRGLQNPFTLEQTLDKLRHYLSAINRQDGVDLLEKAVNTAKSDPLYAARMKKALLHGSSVEYRELFSNFGEYFEKPRATFPFYPHHDAVNSIDTAMFHIKLGYEEQAIDDFNFLHS